MTNSKSTKRALLTSALAVVMCCAMLIGTTFAWFTDTASSKGNKIHAGKLDVQLLMHNGSDYAEITDASAPIFGDGSIAQNNNAETLWEPGKTQVAYLAIKNNGNLDLKYTVKLNVTNTAGDLYEVMQYAITPDAQPSDVTAWTTGSSVTTGVVATDAVDVALAKGATHYFALSVHMDEAAGNAYQDGAVEFDIDVYATQLTSEEDSFGNSYDAGATYSNGTYVANGVMQVGNTYEISNAAGLNWFNDQVNNNNNSFNYKTIKLTADINMNGATWLPVGQNFATYDYPTLGYANTVEFRGTFDGNGKTISNIKIGGLTGDQVGTIENSSSGTTDQQIYSVGFFGYTCGTVKNLTIDNAEVKGFHNVGAIVGYTDTTSYIENCHVKNTTISCTHLNDDQCGDKAGGIVGFINDNVAGDDIKDCSVTNVTITAGRDAGYAIGCSSDADINNVTASNVTLISDTACTHSNHGGNMSGEIVGRAA